MYRVLAKVLDNISEVAISSKLENKKDNPVIVREWK